MGVGGCGGGAVGGGGGRWGAVGGRQGYVWGQGRIRYTAAGAAAFPRLSLVSCICPPMRFGSVRFHPGLQTPAHAHLLTYTHTHVF